ncbi:MAG: DUF4350 domain-containing protein, partial [Verrucomicrobiae bacterium]|nr:DUF4350 domain-containing protein [Verrucomicrobiae bacterium]
MLQTKRWALMLAGCTVALGAALIWLFELRFESGEFYPPYSSLRADPLGCRALYESLRELDHLHVRRNLSQQLSLPQPRGQTLCRFGVEPSRLWVQPLQAQALDSFVRAGGRLVVTFSPSVWATQTTIGTNPRRRAEAKPARRLAINLAEKWGLDLSHAPLPEGAGPVSASVHQAVHDLPSSVSWYSTLVFTNLDAAWKTIYQRDQHPVLIERTLGNGTIVLATDSYFVSNEALLRERHPTLLAWVIGVANAVCFDETHHGIAERPGIATLLRKYRLHGPVAVF